MSAVELGIVAVKTATLLLGGAITLLAYRASRASGRRALGLLALGFGIVTCGALLAGSTDLLLGVALPVSSLVQSTVTAVGFAVILYSLYVIE